MSCSETSYLAREVLKTKIATDRSAEIMQRKGIRSTLKNQPKVAEFRNSTFVKEVEIKMPFFYSALQGGVKDDMDFNKIA